MKKILFSLFVFGLFFGGSLYAGAVSPLETVVDEILSLRQGAVKGASVSTPILTTTEVTSITEQSALVWGNVSDSGGSTVTKRGIVWGATLNPVIDNNLPYQQQEASTAGNGLFTARAYALSPDTTYHARAYAINSFGTAYGNDLTFRTAKVGSITAPIVTTSSATNIAPTSVTLGGDITSDGGATITERGIVWGTASNPTTSSSGKSSDPSWATGAFTKNITGLTPGTTYYARAYAINNRGTSYGSNVSFKTLTVINGGWTAWANQGGCVSNLQTQVRTCTNPAPANGGAPCSGDATQTISCTPNPYIKVTYPNGGEVFTAGQPINIKWTSNYIGSNELVNVYLYVPSKNWSQVVATRTPNDGSEIFYDSGFLDEYGKIFKVIVSPSSVAVVQDTSDDFFTINKTTSSTIPVISTFHSITNETATSALISGTITSDGGSPVTERGIVWNTGLRPTISDNKISAGSGIGDFSGYMTGLTPNTDYSVRLYAKNNVGVAYSNEMSFSTLNCSSGTIWNGVQCANSSSPSITVISPNGGEVYTAGQQITVKWTVSNVPDSSVTTIALVDKNGNNYYLKDSYCTSLSSCIYIHNGYYTVTIPETLKSGLYKARVVCSATNSDRYCVDSNLEDLSDNYFTITSSTNPNPVSPCGSYGDVNGDGDISDNDVAMISQMINGTGSFTDAQEAKADVNADGAINLTDKNLVIDYSSKKITTFPVCSVYLLQNIQNDELEDNEITCKQISQPASTFCPNGKVEAVTDSNQCIISYKCVTSENISKPQCSDGLDNDQDGTIDQGDANCHYGLDLTKGYVANFSSESSSGLLSARTLRVGSRGSDVASLQKYLDLKADGIFGRITASAVREWQAKNGLVGDSIFGAKSFSKLMEEKMLMERSTIGQ